MLKNFFSQIMGGGAWPLLATGWLRPCLFTLFSKLPAVHNLNNNDNGNNNNNRVNSRNYNFAKTDWRLLGRYINSDDFCMRFFAGFDYDSPETSISNFHSIVKELINLFVSISNLPKFNHWRSPELTRLKALVRIDFGKFRKSRRVDDQLAYRRTRNVYVAAIRTHKGDWILNTNLKDQRVGKSPWGTSFKLFFDKMKKSGHLSVDRMSDNCTLDALNDLLDSSFPDDSLANDTSFHSHLREQYSSFSLNSLSSVDHITSLEVSSAVDRLSCGKSPGMDGIKACFWKKFYYFNNSFLDFLFDFGLLPSGMEACHSYIYP